MPWWTQSKKKKWKKKEMGEKREVDERHKEQKNQRTGVDVLAYMFVTAAVFHLETSALNADAELNAVKVNAVVDPIEKRKVKEETKNEEMGEKREIDERHKKHKQVEWTYFDTCSSPPPCPTWKGPR
jgi:hypothetical protein